MFYTFSSLTLIDNRCCVLCFNAGKIAKVTQGFPLSWSIWKGWSLPKRASVDTDVHIVKFPGRLPRSSLVKIAKSWIVSSGPAVNGPTPVSIEGMAMVNGIRTKNKPRQEKIWSLLTLSMSDAKEIMMRCVPSN